MTVNDSTQTSPVTGAQATREHGLVLLSVRELPPGSYRVVHTDFPGGSEASEGGAEPSGTVFRNGILGQIVRTPQPQLLRLDGRQRNDAVLGRAPAGFQQLLALPVIERGEVRWWLVWLLRRSLNVTPDALELAMLGPELLAAMGGNAAILRELQAPRHRLDQELDLIGEMHRAMLPKSLPEAPGWDLAAKLQLCDRSGGDYYAFRVSPEHDRLFFVLADASGHGPAATMSVAGLHTLLSDLSPLWMRPSEVLDELNRSLIRHSLDCAFVTAVAGRIDLASGFVELASAGSPPVFRTPADGGEPELIEQTGPPLGIEASFPLDDFGVEVGPGATLVAFTDGLIEAESPSGEAFGLERWGEAVQSLRGRSAAAAADELFQHVTRFSQRPSPSDDQSLLLFRRRPDTDTTSHFAV